MPMPPGFVPTTGLPSGWQAWTLRGVPVVRVGCNGAPERGIAEWTSYESPELSPDAIKVLEHDRMLYGDCYLELETGARVSPADVYARQVDDLREVGNANEQGGSVADSD